MSLIQCAKQLALAGVGHEVVIAAGKRIPFDEWLGDRKPSTNNVAVEKLRKQIEDGLAEIKSPKAKLAEIKKSITADADAKFQQAMKSCYIRMESVVSHISKTLKQEDPRIFDTLVTNARDLVECLEDLNIANDPHLEQLRQDLDAMLPSTARALKHNPDLRAKVADEADAILEKMKGYV